jgi:hypothetical protein
MPWWLNAMVADGSDRLEVSFYSAVGFGTDLTLNCVRSIPTKMAWTYGTECWTTSQVPAQPLGQLHN